MTSVFKLATFFAFLAAIVGALIVFLPTSTGFSPDTITSLRTVFGWVASFAGIFPETYAAMIVAIKTIVVVDVVFLMSSFVRWAMNLSFGSGA